MLDEIEIARRNRAIKWLKVKDVLEGIGAVLAALLMFALAYVFLAIA